MIRKLQTSTSSVPSVAGEAAPCQGEGSEADRGRRHHDGGDEECRASRVMGLVAVRDSDHVADGMDQAEIEREGQQGRKDHGGARDGQGFEGVVPASLPGGARA